MSHSKSIAIVLPDLRGGGAERVSLNLAQYFLKMNYKVYFILMLSRGEFLSKVPIEIEVIDLSVHRLRQVPFAFSRAIKHLNLDAIIVNMWPLTFVCAIGRLFSSFKGVLLTVDHNTLSQAELYKGKGVVRRYLMRFSLKLTHRLVDVSVGVSTGVVKDIADLSWENSSRFHVAYNPVIMKGKTAHKEIEENTFWPRSNVKKILNIGSLTPQKNQALLIKAFSILKKDVDAFLIILGAGDMHDELLSLAKDEGVEDSILMLGFVSDPSLYYQTADLFVLSSDYDGLPTVLIEALSFGMRIVSTDCPSGPSEILEHGQFGILSPVGDVTSLAKSMERSFYEKPEAERLKARAECFSPSVSTAKYIDLLFSEKKANNVK